MSCGKVVPNRHIGKEMEFAEFIKTPMVNNVTLRRPFMEPLEGTLCVTGHQLILSSRRDDHEELWVSSNSTHTEIWGTSNTHYEDILDTGHCPL